MVKREGEMTDRKNMGTQHQGMDRPAVRHIRKGREQRKMEETGCEVIFGAPMTPVVKGWMKMKNSTIPELYRRPIPVILDVTVHKVGDEVVTPQSVPRLRFLLTRARPDVTKKKLQLLQGR